MRRGRGSHRSACKTQCNWSVKFDIADFGAANDPAPNVALPTVRPPLPAIPVRAPTSTKQTKPSTTKKAVG